MNRGRLSLWTGSLVRHDGVASSLRPTLNLRKEGNNCSLPEPPLGKHSSFPQTHLFPLLVYILSWTLIQGSSSSTLDSRNFRVYASKRDLSLAPLKHKAPPNAMENLAYACTHQSGIFRHVWKRKKPLWLDDPTPLEEEEK